MRKSKANPHLHAQLPSPDSTRVQVQQAIAGQEQALDASRSALSGAAAEQRELEHSGRGVAEAVESLAQRASRLQADLLAAKEKVDLAQVR